MTETRRLEVDREASGTRLDRWLAQSSGRGRTDIQRLISSGLVRVDGRKAAKSMKVQGGQLVEIDEPPPPPKAVVSDVEVPVRFEDEHLAVVSKPAGLVVHSVQGPAAPTMVDVLAEQMPLAPASGEHRRGVVHRLDKGTSGLLVVAKTDRAYHALVAQMKAREVQRTYRAMVVGTFSLPTGRIEAPVGRSASRPTYMSVSPGGRAAVTEFEVLEELQGLSLLAVKLLTGQTHQIRVHLAHIHRPVVGDTQYGGGADQLPQVLGLSRPFLHAWALQFTHPFTREVVRVEEALPPDLRTALQIARDRAGMG